MTEQVFYSLIAASIFIFLQVKILRAVSKEQRNRKIFEKYIFESLNIIDKRVLPIDIPLVSKKPKKAIVLTQDRNGEDEFNGDRDDFH